jgi:hypothetical protein
MKAMRTFIVVMGGVAIIIAFLGMLLMYRGVKAQSTRRAANPTVVGQYEQLVSSLSKRGDTNSAMGVANLVTAMHTGRAVTDLSTTVRILESLRSGRTNDAIQLLESRLDAAVMSFDAPSDVKRDQIYDPVLKMAKEYRNKHPYKEGVPEIDTVVERVFKSLPQ